MLPAQKELAEKIDIRFEIEEIKNGTRVVSLIFHIFKNENEPREPVNDDEYINSEPVADLLLRFEIKKRAATDLLKKYGEERIRENIKYVFTRSRNQEVSNLSGYIIKAIEDNYASTEHQYTFENEGTPHVSLDTLNKRISQIVFFYDEAIKSEMWTQSEGHSKIVYEIAEVLQTPKYSLREELSSACGGGFISPVCKRSF